jgi:hypothetical protein
MVRKILSLFLMAALIGVASSSPAQADTKEEKAAAFTQKVKVGITQLGTGTDARVELKLRDKTKLKGWISETGETGFVVMEANSGKAVPVAYPAVTQVRGHHGHYGTRLLIATAVTLLVTVLVIVLSERD